MCWHISERIESSIAKEDIEVYKIGSPNKKKDRFNCLYNDTFFYIKDENTLKQI